MGKLVVFKLGDGNFEQGFPITLQIGEDGDRPSTEITGKLPPAPEIPQHYRGWQSAYCRLGWRSRLEAEAVQVTNFSIIEDCVAAVQVLSHSLNTWLHSDSFRSIREKLLEKLMPSDEVRVIFQAEDIRVQRLPWHLCDLFERYPKAEVALSAPAYERQIYTSPPTGKVKILAILGNSTGIDTQADRRLLEQLPGAAITFLVEPQRQELTNQLWGQGWDILFFAGHSASGANGEIGRIYINKTDSLSISDLKYALQTAVEHGLKLAIFNSCDGLGLARDLATLYIPQIIVMREPVPDQVAQKFLKYFLKAFAGGKAFYLAVREARERLQGLEDEFPCASWLPVIYQNLAEVPPTWQKLCAGVDPNLTTGRPVPNLPVLHVRHRLLKVLLTSVIVTASVMGVRHLGIIQGLELTAFDNMTRIRPDEGPDQRLLVITVTEDDFQAPEQKQRKGSLSDLALERILEKIEPYQPRAIGLDVYHDQPVDPKQAALAKRMQSNDNFFAICRGRDTEANFPGTAPPPKVPKARQGFSDVVLDTDGILRRQLLAIKPSSTSPCTAPYALSAQLAFHYLQAEGISPKYTEKGDLQLGKVVVKRLQAHNGGYQNVDAWGYQILLNYRSYRSPLEVAPTVTLTDVLTGKVKPDDVKGRIVLIGVTAQSAHDYLATPYSSNRGFYQEIPGVIIQAHMVSQLLSAVLDGRPLLEVWPLWGEVLWVWGWSVVGGALAWRCRSRLHLLLTGGVALGVLYVMCFGLFTQGSWVPFVPSVLALVFTSSSVMTYPALLAQRQQYIHNFES